MKVNDIQTRKQELIELIDAWVKEKQILEPDEVIEVDLRITKPSKIRVSIEGYHGTKDTNLVSVFDLGLSVRASNRLNNADINTVGELRVMSTDEMLKLKNFGKKSIREIQDKLLGIGVEVKWLP